MQVVKSALLMRIAEMVNEKKLEGIADLRDESDRNGIRMVSRRCFWAVSVLTEILPMLKLYRQSFNCLFETTLSTNLTLFD